jgi:hypothetical protein
MGTTVKEFELIRLLHSHHGEHPLVVSILRVFSHFRLHLRHLGNSPYTFAKSV